MNFYVFFIVSTLITSTLSHALKVTNLSNKLYEITFIVEQISAPHCVLETQQHVNHFEVFGNLEFDKTALVSVKIKQSSVDGSEIIWEKLPPQAELIIPAELLVITTNDADKKSSYLESLSNITSFIAYYGGLLVSIPLGALGSMEPAAKLGAMVAPKLLPSIALQVSGHTLFYPLHYFGSGLIGVIGGYAVGAFGGALLAPLIFSVVYNGGARVINYCTQEKEMPVLLPEGKLEDSWLYLPNYPVQDPLEESMDDWVIIGENELPPK